MDLLLVFLDICSIDPFFFAALASVSNWIPSPSSSRARWTLEMIPLHFLPPARLWSGCICVWAEAASQCAAEARLTQNPCDPAASNVVTYHFQPVCSIYLIPLPLKEAFVFESLQPFVCLRAAPS